MTTQPFKATDANPAQGTPESNVVLRMLDLRGKTLSTAELKAALPRTHGNDSSSAEEIVRDVIASVQRDGLGALRGYAQTFDGVEQGHPRVPVEELNRALENLDPAVRSALEESIRRATLVSDEQRPEDSSVRLDNGAVVSNRWIPVRRVGLYVPGGLAVYPSSVIMNVVPALAAGVESIALASPPQKDHNGLPHPTILAAAQLLGITEVYAIGGAQAIATFAYGVPGDDSGDGIEPVNVITGPGNIFVATAKRLVKGAVGIDSEAGPTEIAILADSTATSAFVAADLVSQAEHDPKAAAVLITDSPLLAQAVSEELRAQVAATTHRERVVIALNGVQSGVVLVDSIEQGISVCNAYAAEHLEIMTADAPYVASQIVNAGAIFVGEYSPVSLGDYCAGSNHVLPTSGTAAFSSGLNVTTFMRSVQLINYERSSLQTVSEHIVNLSRAENLPAHGDAVAIRFTDLQPS